MPIVITPTGQFVDSVTGNPVDLPPQRPDLPMRERTGSALTAEELQSDIGPGIANPGIANPGMGSLSGVPSGNERPMVMPTPRPEDLMMRQMPSGRDRTFNPRDAINPYNAPNT